jgi:hypothetical protein
MSNTEISGVDFIGDVHGNADKLATMLHQLGYRIYKGSWVHPFNRIAFFLGDFINVGIQNRQVYKIIRTMCESNRAVAIAGNHEFFLSLQYFEHGRSIFSDNICMLLPDYDSLIREVSGNSSELEDMARWFMALPLFFESPDFRVVHAAWSPVAIQKIRTILNRPSVRAIDVMPEYSRADSEIRGSINTVLNGKLIALPDPEKAKKQLRFRTRWWETPENLTLHQLILSRKEIPFKNIPVTREMVPDAEPYGQDERPVFFGHYWMRGTPYLIRPNVCCLDFGAAKGGHLSAYRWSKEANLQPGNIIYI